MDFNSKIKDSGIYKITNLVNDRFYIGSTFNFYERFIQHRADLRKNKHNNQFLQNSWNKYGEENFSFAIMEVVSNIDDLLIREQHWLDETNSYNRCVGYNIAKNAKAPMTGLKHSNEAKEKISKVHKGKIISEEQKEKASNFHKGKTISDLQKEQIRHSVHEYWTEEKRNEHSLLIKEIRKNNPEISKKISIANKGKSKNISDEERIRRSESKKGSNHHNAKLSEETVREIKLLLLNGTKQKVISEKFSISISQVSKIAKGNRWSHVVV